MHTKGCACAANIMLVRGYISVSERELLRVYLCNTYKRPHEYLCVHTCMIASAM